MNGNEYKTVNIGNQVWMAENLRATHFNDGTKIPHLTNHIAWFTAKGSAYCWFDNDSASNAKTYGALYNLETVNSGKLCPKGWQVSAEGDWQSLIEYLGGEENSGNKLKEAGNDHWFEPNTGASNESGFTAVPGGYRYVDGSYVLKGYVGFWWTSSKTSGKANVFVIRHDNSGVFKSQDRGIPGYSVRCIKQSTHLTTPKESILRVKRIRPVEWEKLVPGGRFMDRLLPMPEGTVGRDVWGVNGVQKRYADNGIEHPDYSFWGGNILLGDDGKYHFYVCGWPEKLRNGHSSWPFSKVYHTTSKDLIGPYTIQDTVVPGGNPETYRMTDGRYAMYTFFGRHANRTFSLSLADTPEGPWETVPFKTDYRDREAIFITNMAFAKREDGSFIAVGKKGEIWISQTGATPYNLILEKSVYPDIEGIFEDAVLWRDNVQYNMIMHDWTGHVAYYIRSKDGIHWVTDPGEAYELGCALHADGYVEDWVTFERMKVFQDEYGRAIQANFAVIDTLKTFDKGEDRHSSKNISIPLNPGLLLSWEGQEKKYPESTFDPVIRIKAEKGFNPVKELDISSLRFGGSNEVNYGRGSKVIASEKVGKDLILTFDSNGHEISETEFAPKLLGKDLKGNMVFAYLRLPWVEYELPILSARSPRVMTSDTVPRLSIEIENFGIVASQKAELIVRKDDKEIGKVSVPVIQPYEKVTVKIDTPLKKGMNDLVIETRERKNNVSYFNTSVKF